MSKEEKKSAETSMTPEEIESLKKQAVQATEYWDQLLRLKAEFENTRKRMLKEQLEYERRAGERLFADMLDVVDDFERALAAAKVHSNEEHLKMGLEMVYVRLMDFLKTHGVERIQAVGEPFDPLKHEAVAHEETADFPEATVIEELRKGYTMDGRVIRPATVKVAVKPQNLETR